MGFFLDRYAIIGFWVSLAVSAICAAPLLKLLIRLKSRQTISAYVPEHQEKQGTPTMGGLIIVAGVVAALAVLAGGGHTRLVEALILFLGFGAIGFVDDYVVPKMMAGKRGLGWKQKILMELVLAILPLVIFEHGSPWAIFGGVFLILGMANAFNFTDGLDGLAGSVGLALFGGLAVMCASTPASLTTDLILCVVLMASFIPFLYLNAPPAKVFMGDVGSLPVGAVIGLVFWHLATAGGGFSDVGLFVTSLVMCAELFPVPIQIASVKLRKKRVFLMTPIHHAFQKQGMPETRIVWRYALIQLVLSAAGASIYLWALQIH